MIALEHLNNIKKMSTFTTMILYQNYLKLNRFDVVLQRKITKI